MIKKDKLFKIKTKYYVYKKKDKDFIKNFLCIRKINTKIKSFIDASINDLIKVPLLNEEEAANLILKKIKKKEKIGIYGDSDTDGITSTVIAISILKKLGAKVYYHINNRFKEGFGLNMVGIEKLKKEKISLIITVDNGITSVETIEKAKELGIDIIVTDHHEPNSILPNTIVVNPKQAKCEYPNKEISGAGVIFKVLLNVCEKVNKRNMALKYLDLVALGTVADMASVLGENRIIIKNGLKLWNWNKGRINLKTFKEALNMNNNISSSDLGFVFAPILNSEGRLYGKPKFAIEALLKNNIDEIKNCINFLIKTNEKRKKITQEQISIANFYININKNFLFIFDEKIKEGIAGLIANKFLEIYKKPVLVLCRDNNNNIKGSGRATEGFNFKKILDGMKDLLLSYGGHKLACGICFEKKNLEKINNIFESKAKQNMKKNNNLEKIIFDSELKIKNINEKFFKELEQLEPFGINFEKPIFIIKNIIINNIKYLKKKHSKFNVSGIEFLCFNKLLENFKEYHFGGFLQKNYFNNKETLQFVVKHVLDGKIEIYKI